MADILHSALLEVPHGFSTRQGTSADDLVQGGRLVTVRQVHSAEAVVAEDAWTGEPPEADAIVTDRPGLVLGIVTADCAPVLLADTEAGVVGAAHAGWRGAHGGVIENTVAAMVRLGARAGCIEAAIGPCIARQSYEVDAGFRALFDAADEPFFDPGRAGHCQFDLPAYVGARLRAAGVGAVDDLALDTYAAPECFFSYRRASHLGQPTGGRQISLVGLRRTS